uniref:Large ribosomal subunit protein uL6 alpha-beta domain-containing protein n=1 Tax=Ostreococcus mediterraneus TaxID=1486918 RepID=A0A6U0B6U3_9CHLO|mmetsp:Transcript_7631/g.27957  ORF Transcript_7631/g.27957 Transcript_7631/m.27957 type:complete len:214 (-) Transcript_7631:185-826(-)
MLAAQVSSFVRGDTTIRAKRAESTKPTARRAIEAKESRIGKVPVAVPKGVTYTLKDNMLAVKGPKGSMEMQFPDVVVFTEEGEAIKLSRANDTPDARKGHGLYRTLANNMMVGVSTGFEKKLKLLGVGYKAAMQGKNLNLSLGYSHPVIMEIPKGLEVKCDSNTDITVSGFDKVEVGNFAAIIRSKRPPEPYKGKGIRYADEVVIQKEGKRGK